MGITVLTTDRGHTVRIHDPIKPNSPEWEARQKRWELSCVRFWQAKERTAARNI